MTVKELKNKIKDFPDDMDVMIEKNNDEFHFGLLQSAKSQEVIFESGDNKDAEIECLVLSDEI